MEDRLEQQLMSMAQLMVLDQPHGEELMAMVDVGLGSRMQSHYALSQSAWALAG